MHHKTVLRNEHPSRQDDKIVLTDRNGVPRGFAQVINKRAQTQHSRTNGYYYRRVVIIKTNV